MDLFMHLPEMFKAQGYSPADKVSQTLKFGMGIGLVLLAQHWSQQPFITVGIVASSVFVLKLGDKATDTSLGLKYRGFHPILRGALTAAMVSSGLMAFRTFNQLEHTWMVCGGISWINAVLLISITKKNDPKKFLTKWQA
jgi:hypothetical protein